MLLRNEWWVRWVMRPSTWQPLWHGRSASDLQVNQRLRLSTQLRKIITLTLSLLNTWLSCLFWIDHCSMWNCRPCLDTSGKAKPWIQTKVQCKRIHFTLPCYQIKCTFRIGILVAMHMSAGYLLTARTGSVSRLPIPHALLCTRSWVTSALLLSLLRDLGSER
jgi:hypothetical protein